MTFHCREFALVDTVPTQCAISVRYDIGFVSVLAICQLFIVKALDNLKKRSSTQKQLDYANSLKAKHIETYSSARKAVVARRQRAILFPRDHLFVSFDDMDNQVLFF